MSTVAIAFEYAVKRFCATFKADSSAATTALLARALSNTAVVIFNSLATVATVFLFATSGDFLSFAATNLLRLVNIPFFLV